MKCKVYKKIIYLYKTGELTQKHRGILNSHIEHCPNCEKLVKELHITDKTIEKLKNIQPELSGEKELTDNIIMAINKIENKPKELLIPFNWDNLVDWFYFPRIKYALISIAIALIGIFIFQQSIILYKIAALEEKAVKKEIQTENNAITSSGTSLKVINNSKIIDDIKTSNPELIKDLIVINKKNLELWAESYAKLKNENEMLIKYIRENFPEYEEKISEKDIKDLVKRLSKDKQVIELLHEL